MEDRVYYCLTWATDQMPAPAFDYYLDEEKAVNAFRGPVPRHRNVVRYRILTLDARRPKDDAEWQRVCKAALQRT